MVSEHMAENFKQKELLEEFANENLDKFENYVMILVGKRPKSNGEEGFELVNSSTMTSSRSSESENDFIIMMAGIQTLYNALLRSYVEDDPALQMFKGSTVAQRFAKEHKTSAKEIVEDMVRRKGTFLHKMITGMTKKMHENMEKGDVATLKIVEDGKENGHGK